MEISLSATRIIIGLTNQRTGAIAGDGQQLNAQNGDTINITGFLTPAATGVALKLQFSNSLNGPWNVISTQNTSTDGRVTFNLPIVTQTGGYTQYWMLSS